MIHAPEYLPSESQGWQEMDKFHYPTGVRHASNRSSFCSTCSSYESDDSEGEDSLSRWPWIPFIQEDGSLFFLEPFFEPQKKPEKEEENVESSKSKNSNKKDESGRLLKGFGRIKGALKRNATFAKKNKEKESDDIKEEGKSMSENNTKNSDYLIEDNYEIQPVRKTTVVNVERSLSPELDVNSNLLEEILGVISGLDLDPVNAIIDTANYGLAPNRINALTIQGLIPNSPAHSNQDISIGDILLAVNGVEVSQRNINMVLAKIRWPSEVILTIEKEIHIQTKPKVKSKIIDLMTGAIDDFNELAAYQETCAVMYLTLDSNEDDAEGDILFWYPDSKLSAKLKSVRGMFLTIADLMNNVTGTEAKSSTLLIQNDVIHVCYQKVAGNLLAVAAPDRKCNLFTLEQSVIELKRQMDFLYQSADQAFHPDNREDLQHLFVLFMERLLHGLPVKSQSEMSNVTAACLSGVKYLQLPPDKQVWISNTLSDAEAADYGECADDFFPHRRLYTTLGSCLFYKGHLVSNHLPESDLLDCIVFCKHHCLLTMTEEQRVSQLVVWKEVFPVKKNEKPDGYEGCFVEPSVARWFLLVVGQKHSLLNMLLEAGGAASIPEGSPGPHPYYVDTAASILAYIQEALDFETICEAKLRGSSIPALISPTEVTNSRQNSNSTPLEISLRKLPAHLESLGMKYSPSIDSIKTLTRGEESPRQSKQSVVSSPFSSRRSNSDDSGSAGSSMKVSVSNYSAASSPFRNNPPMNGENTSLISTKLTTGPVNTLLYYTSCDKAKGILLCPPASCSDAINKDILDNFHKACQLIRQTFTRESELRINGNGHRDENEAKTQNRVYEQGLLFKRKLKKGADQKKSQNILKYWVIGRRLKDDSKEFFVCYTDGIPQSAVELAFRFGFGTVI